ncbi:MAG: HlyC/CorC family transporter [Deltaproteobacteria bacterium]|nr:HlyC/CorC family transporter [Deltaproteobacteria bacterium]
MDDLTPIGVAGRLLAVLVIVLANAYFVVAEFSLVAIRRSRVTQLVAEGRPHARAVERMGKDLNTFLSATQLGITMTSLALGWIGEPAVARLFVPFLGFLPDRWGEVGAHGLATALAFATVTMLHIVLGELAPKNLALQHTEKSALAVAPPLEILTILFRPAIIVLNATANLVLSLVGLKRATGEDQIHSVEELKLLVSASRAAGILGEEAEGIVERAFAFDDFSARQVMVPRIEMAAVPLEAHPQAALDVAIREHHTRLPVFRGDLDDIVGSVHIADLVAACRQGGASDLSGVVRPALLVPESIPTDTLLTRMRLERAHMALLVDEYGGTAGLVTLHDLVERLVGPVADAEEVARDRVDAQPDGSVILGGMVLVHDANERFGLGIEEGDFDTLGGLVLARLGRLPLPGDEIRIAGWVLRVEAIEGRRVDRIRLLRAEIAHNRG